MRQTYRKPTMKDVAEKAGVSITTVSHVVNGTRFVSADITAKVEIAIDKLKFKVNPIARNLRSGKSHMIGFVVSNLENSFYVNIARGIEKTINAQGYQLILIDSEEKKRKEIKNVESLYLRGVDGIIIAPTNTDCSYLDSLLPPRFPLVFVDRQPSNFPADCLLLNNAAAGYEAIKYLIGKGHTRIGFISFLFGDVDKTIMERLEGYRQAFREAGLAINEDYIKVVHGSSVAVTQLRHAEPYEIMKTLHKLHIEAVLCGNSLSAIGAFTYLKDTTVSIPKDIALITFDDDLWLSMTTPQITAVVQPAEAMGAMAAGRLIKRIQGKKLPYKALRLNADIIFRGSS